MANSIDDTSPSVTPRFNLIDEPWIPVRWLDGRHGELGIRDTLLQAEHIAEIQDASPLVVAALHRFLLAVLYRALEGPTDGQQARALFKGGIPAEKVTSYLDLWKHRFDLFDKTHPFGQNPNVPPKQVEPWTKLTAEFNGTSNRTLFDHTTMQGLVGRQPNECARWLISTMNFSLSGGRGYYPSPSVNAVMCFVMGRHLSETLVLNLVPYPNRFVAQGDSALWERDPLQVPLTGQKRMVSSYADLYTWPARLVLLLPDRNNLVRDVRFMAGQGCELPSNFLDPLQPYKNDEKLGRLPVRFEKSKGTWRDFDSLLPDADDLAPRTVAQSFDLVRGTKDRPKAFLVLGLRYEPPNANVDFWRMERFNLPDNIRLEFSFRAELNKLLLAAKDAETALWHACKSFSRNLLSRGEREPAGRDVSNFVRQMPVIDSYWSSLEPRFHQTLAEYTEKHDPEDIRLLWFRHVRDAMHSAWRVHASGVAAGDAWAIRALVQAEAPVLRHLAKLNDEISKLEPQEEPA